MLIFVAFLALIPPKIIGLVIDGVTDNTLTSEQLTRWLIILVIAGIIMYVARYFWRVMIFGSAVYLART